MPKGRTLRWNASRGFGFISPDDGGPPLFVHFTDLDMYGLKTLEVDQEVEYEYEDGPRGPRARRVCPVELRDELDTRDPVDISLDQEDIAYRRHFVTKRKASSQGGPLEVRRSGVSIALTPKEPLHRKLTVFLCHSKVDKPIVRALYQRLTKISYISPWFDEMSLLPGQDWNSEITKAVAAADVVLVCLSGGSVEKDGYVQKEIAFALDKAEEKAPDTIYLIPVRLNEFVLPSRLAKWHYVHYFHENAFDRLLLSFQARATSLGLVVTNEV